MRSNHSTQTLYPMSIDKHFQKGISLQNILYKILVAIKKVKLCDD